MTRVLALVCFAIASLMHVAAPAHAVVERECLVTLQSKNGWAKEYKATVLFMTGLELSRVTTALPVEFHQIYAVISLGRGLPTVARLDLGLQGVKREFNAGDYVRLFAADGTRVATQIIGEGRNLKWRLRARTSHGWVDEDMPPLSGMVKHATAQGGGA